jgi:autotransporter-associated beta strand protein
MAARQTRKLKRSTGGVIRAVLESLENRRLLTVAVWTGGANDDLWNTPANWQADAAPTPGQSVDFPAYSGSGAYIGLTSNVTVGDITFEGGYELASSTITVDGNISVTNANTPIASNLRLNHDTTITIGPGAGLYVYAISDGGGNYGITKQGGGDLSVEENGSYTGNTVVAAGTLYLNSALASSLTVDSGATVVGSYFASAAGITDNGGTIQLTRNDMANSFASTGPVSGGSGSTLLEGIDDNGQADDGSAQEEDSELIASGSSIDLTGATLQLDVQSGYTPPVGEVITLISNQTGQPVTGTFAGLPEGALINLNGVDYHISYVGGQSGQDVTLSVGDFWTGAANDGLWSDAGNWEGDAVPPSGADVIFPADGTSNQNITLDQNETVNSMTLHGTYAFMGDDAIHLGSSLYEDSGQEDTFFNPIVLDQSITMNMNGLVVFAGGVSESAAGLALTINGFGPVYFAYTADSYTGTTEVTDGQLMLAAPTSSPILVDSAALLAGGGGEVPSVDLNGGTLLSTFDAGEGLTIDSQLTMSSGSTLSFFLEKQQGTQLGQDTVTVNAGSINLTGVTLSLLNTNYTATDSDFLTLIKNNTGAPVVGTFAGIPQGGIISAGGRNYVVSYQGGTSQNDVTLTIVPNAPAVWTGGANDGMWNNPGNWQADATPLPTQSVDFPTHGGGNVTYVDLTSNVTVGDLSFEGATHLVSSTITVDGNLTVNTSLALIQSSLLLTHNTTVTLGSGDALEADAISDGGDDYGITVQGNGNMVIFGNSTYTGITHITAGRLNLNATLTSSVIVDSGATLLATARASTTGVTDNGGTVQLGQIGLARKLISTGPFSLGSGSTLLESIDDSGPGQGHGLQEEDGQVTASGSSIDLTGSTLQLYLQAGYTPPPGQVVTLIANQTGQPITGTFSGIPDGGTVSSNGRTYSVSYLGGSSGHDVTLTLLPLPIAVWTGGANTTSWSDAANWQGDAVPLPTQSVDFPNLSGSELNVDIDADQTVGDISFEGNYIINSVSNALTIDGNITANGNNDEIYADTVLTHDTTATVGPSSYLGMIAVSDAGNGYGLIKAGPGGMILDGGSHTYTGTTEVAAGRLGVYTALPGPIIVDSGATLIGQLTADSVTSTGGTVILGFPIPGIYGYATVTSGFTLDASSTLTEQLAQDPQSVTPGVINATGGTINLNDAALNLEITNAYNSTNATPAPGDVYTLVNNQTGSPVIGTFASLPEGATITAGGTTFHISYAGGTSHQDVTLTVPGTPVLPNPPPTVVSIMPDRSTPSLRPALSILAADPATGNASDLTYTWSVALAPSGARPVTFSENHTNAARTATARFQNAGTYRLLCTITNTTRESTTKTADITIKQIATRLRLTPHRQVIAAGDTMQYGGVALDQFGHPMRTTPTISFAIKSGDGSIDDSGLFSAGQIQGHAIIEITEDGLTGLLGATIE